MSITFNQHVLILRTLFIYRLTKEHFLFIAKLIIKLFPTEELELYFELVKSCNSRGKLFSCYRNLRSQLIACKLVNGRKRGRQTQEEEQQEPKDQNNGSFAILVFNKNGYKLTRIF